MYPKALRLEVVRVIESHGPLSSFDIKSLVSLPTTAEAIESTVKNGVKHGWLEVVGSEKQPQCLKWVYLYDVAQPVEEALPASVDGVAALCAVLGGWGASVRCPKHVEANEEIYA